MEGHRGLPSVADMQGMSPPYPQACLQHSAMGPVACSQAQWLSLLTASPKFLPLHLFLGGALNPQNRPPSQSPGIRISMQWISLELDLPQL